MSWPHRAALSALLAIAAVGYLWAQEADGGDIPMVARQRVSPLSPSPAAVEAGEDLWKLHCLTCHGAQGRGDGPNARLHAARKAPPQDLSNPMVQDNLTDGEIFWRIGNGIVEDDDVIMPAYGDQIPDEQARWQLVQFVRTLRAPPDDSAR